MSSRSGTAPTPGWRQAAARPLRRSVLPSPHPVICIAFAIFVASIPFETVLGPDALSLSRLVGWAFFALALLLQPGVCFRRPPAAFWCFVAYLAVFYVNGYLQGSVSEAGGRVFPQLVVMFWMAYNLLRYQQIFLTTLSALVVSCMAFSWVQLSGLRTYEISGRVSALEENLNSAATVLSLGLVAAVGIAYGQRQGGRLAKWAAWLGFGMMGLGVVRTGSRGGLVALAAGIGVFVLRRGSVWIRLRNAFIVAVGLIALVIMASSFDVSRARWERTFEGGSIGPRERIYPAAWKMFLERPIQGWGAEVMVRELGARTGRGRRDTHNLYLWVLTEDGLLGAIPYFLGLWLCLRGAWRGRKLSYGVVPLALLAVDLVANLSLTWGARKLHWLVLALALASARPLLRATVLRRPTERGKPTGGFRRRVRKGSRPVVVANA